jgi:RNA polymerase sigma-70 factor (ECF subfamily)
VARRADGSDRNLLEDFLRGDHDAFAELMRRHEDRIFALALRMTGSHSDALEATQETFINAFRRAKQFRGDSAFGTWLYRIGINTCKDHLRRRKEVTLEPDAGAFDAPSGVRVDESVVRRLDLRDALTRLPHDYREAVVMHDLGGIPYEEIASLTGAPLGTVKSRISRGRRMLAQLLEHTGSDDPSKDRA